MTLVEKYKKSNVDLTPNLLTLGYQVGHVSGTFGIVLIPAGREFKGRSQVLKFKTNNETQNLVNKMIYLIPSQFSHHAEPHY